MKDLRSQLFVIVSRIRLDDVSDREKEIDNLVALFNKHTESAVLEAKREELEYIDQGYKWKSIVTYSGFKKWKERRFAELESSQPDKQESQL